MKIFEERVSNGVDKVEYRVKVRLNSSGREWTNGDQECKLWVCLNSSSWISKDCAFQLTIYPNGADNGCCGNVSMFLLNKNNEDLYVTYSLRMGIKEKEFEDELMYHGTGTGQPHFYDQLLRCSENEDDELEIICTITKLLKEPQKGELFKNQYQLTKGILSEVEELRKSHQNIIKGQNELKQELQEMRKAQKQFQENVELQMLQMNQMLFTRYGKNTVIADAVQTSQKASMKDVREIATQFGKLSVQVTNIQTEVQMQNPDNYSEFLEKKPPPEDVQNIGSDDD